MKIWKCVDFQKEVEIEITAEDIGLCFEEEGGKGVEIILREINRVAQFMVGIPDVSIENMTEHQKKAIGEFLANQANRYLYPKPEVEDTI